MPSPGEWNPRLLEEVDRPLQPSTLAPDLRRETFVPARGHQQDTRWIIDVQALEHLLEVARRSPSQRVVVHHATVRVRQWRDRASGHVYETFAMLGSRAEPELAGGLIRGTASGSTR